VQHEHSTTLQSSCDVGSSKHLAPTLSGGAQLTTLPVSLLVGSESEPTSGMSGLLERAAMWCVSATLLVTSAQFAVPQAKYRDHQGGGSSECLG
jgi:hypothetical protein